MKLPLAVRRRAAGSALVAMLAAVAAGGPARVAHAQEPISGFVAARSYDSLADLGTDNYDPFVGVTARITDVAGSVVDVCVTGDEGTCNVVLPGPGFYRACLYDLPAGFRRDGETCREGTFSETVGVAGFTFFWVGAADDGNGGNGNGDVNDDEDDVTVTGDHDNTVTGSGQSCSVSKTGLLSIPSPTLVNCVNAPKG
ncbi:hypothetical protein [Streptomyces sp. H62]